jgi:hypothetical protein
MKKLLLAILIFLTSCSYPKTFYVYKYRYNQFQQQQAYHDVYTSLKNFNIDSIPLSLWTDFSSYEEGILFSKKFIIKMEKKTTYFLIFTTYYNRDTTYYNYQIKGETKDKKILKKYKKKQQY